MDEERSALERRIARADLCRFLAACYYEPGPAFVEERLFDSLAAVAARVDGNLGVRAARLDEAFRADTLQHLVVDYTKLFLGPPQALAKPYESVWTDRGAGEMPIVALYSEAGFEVDEAFRDLPDHIAVELEFLYRVIYEDAPPHLYRRLLVEHLSRWIGPFSNAVRSGAQTRFYKELGELTERVIASEAGRLR